MPDASWYPIIASFGAFIFGSGLIGRGAGVDFLTGIMPGWLAHFFGAPLEPTPFTWPIYIGAAILIAAAYLWAMEGPAGYHVHPEADTGHEGHGHASAAGAH